MFIIFALKANAQIDSKTNLSELNQDQLKLALETSTGNMWVGKIMIGKNDIGPSHETVSGLYLLGGGLLFELVGIPTFLIGSNRKTKIEIELAKFNPKGSASINGIGLKINF